MTKLHLPAFDSGRVATVGLVCAVAVTALAGCNPYSRDDIVFALSLPAIEDVAIAPPGVVVDETDDGIANQSAASSPINPVCSDTDLRCTAQTAANNFNSLTFSLLAIIDGVVESPPTFRGVADGFPRRIWGPAFVPDTGSTIRLEMVLDPDGNAFDVCFAAAAGNLANKPTPDEMNCESNARDFGMVTLLGGQFSPGPIENGRARSGRGHLVFDANALNEIAPSGDLLGLYDITYDNTSNTQVVTAHLSEFPQNALVEAEYAFTKEKDSGAGTFAFAVLQDFTPGVFGAGFELERLDVTAQWDETLAGRGDALISGGDLDDLTYGVVHCWGVDFATTHYEDADDNHPTVGAPEDCIFDAPFVP